MNYEEQEARARKYLESNEGSSERRERHNKRQAQKKRRHRILFVVLICMIIVTGITAVISHFISTNVYQDEDEFKDYVDGQLDAEQLFETDGKAEIEYEYGSPISYAVDYNTCDNDEINDFRDKKINIIKSRFEQTKTVEEEKRAKKHGEDFKYRPLEHSLIVSSRIFESENGVISLAIYEQSNTEKDKDMAIESEKLHTYHFSDRTGYDLTPFQIFKEDYREKCMSYFIEFFKKEYDEEELNDGWEQYLSADESNYNKFTVTDTGVVFFFDEGTVLKSPNGVISAGIPDDILGDSLRDSIKERYIDPQKPMVAITYDDGPGGEAENRILDCLEKNGAVATFFYLGNRVPADAKTVKRAYEMGCEIGNHTWNHPVLTSMSMKEVRKQFSKTNNEIKKACGAEPTVFRPSYGETNSKIDKASKMPVIMWTIDTLDWESRNAKKVFKSVKREKNLDGDIILMHSIYDSTAKATELIIPYLKKKGYQIVTISELIKYRYGETPKAGKEYR